MKIKVNGEEQNIEGEPTITDLIKTLGFPTTGNAIAINCSFVPRSAHDTTKIQADDDIEVVSPMQGG